MKAALLLPFVLGLAACSNAPMEDGFFASADRPPLAAVVSPTNAAAPASAPILALPQAAGAVDQVRERLYPNGFRQVIELRGVNGKPSANQLELSVATRGASRRVGWLAIGKPTAGSVSSEILARFPHLRMEIVTRPMYDQLGRFGLAIGRDRSGLRCVFAWQWLDDLRDADPDRPTFRKMLDSVTDRDLPASIRVRLCRRDLTLDQLAGLVEGTSLANASNLRRIDAVIASAASSNGEAIARLNTPGSVLAPLPESLEAALGPAPPPRPAPLRGARKQPALARRRPSRFEGRRRLSGESAPRLPGDDSADHAAGSRAPSGGRYLAPVAPAAADSAPGNAGASVPKVGRSVAVGPKLPPQAFRGPAGAASKAPTSVNPYGAPTPIGAAP